MDQILGVVHPSLKDLQNLRNDDDFADRLSHRITPIMFIVFSVMVWSKQFTGEDWINCWTPAHFSVNHIEYAHEYCWIRNTYYLPDEKYIPKEDEDKHVITYYQWVHLILLVMALLYHLPITLWRSLNKRSGIDVNNIVETSEKFNEAHSSDGREDVLKIMTILMDRYLQSSKQKEATHECTISCKSLFASTVCRCCGRRHGNYLCSLYIVVKLLFITNVIFQFFALNFALGHHYSIYGFDVVRAIINGEEWEASEKFPRVTLCDLKIRRLGNIQRYSIQCLLPVNFFNEKIFLFIWFWMVFVAVVTILSLLRWTVRLVFPTSKYRFVKKHLMLMYSMNTRKIVRYSSELQSMRTIVHKGNIQDQSLITQFVDEYLRPDGVFVLRLVGANTNAITVTSFVNEVWDYWNDPELFKKRRQNRRLIKEQKKRKRKRQHLKRYQVLRLSQTTCQCGEPEGVTLKITTFEKWGKGTFYVKNHHF